MTIEALKDLQELNKLALTPAEEETVLGIFEQMERREKGLLSLNTEDTEVMVHVMPLSNILRDDVRVQQFPLEDLLKRSPEHTEDSWQGRSSVRKRSPDYCRFQNSGRI